MTRRGVAVTFALHANRRAPRNALECKAQRGMWRYHEEAAFRLKSSPSHRAPAIHEQKVNRASRAVPICPPDRPARCSQAEMS